jgi:acetyl coenzyme A synthetase (ADP forming)-like protein
MTTMTKTRTAAGGALAPLFAPRSIAVIGASRHRGTVGAEILHNLLAACRADVYAVNPNAQTIEGTRAWPSVAQIPAAIDLCVIAVPCALVERAIDDCIAAEVPAVVIISAGFAETGAEGRELERSIVIKTRRAGMRMIGPNCMGIVNTDPAMRMNATFASTLPPAGTIAFSSQSGALGLAVLEAAQQLNIGISSFVSIGNKADVSTNDLLEFWETDPRTSVILLYVESFGNPRRFMEIAGRVGRVKPIAAVKSGRSKGGARAASSHTGALAASDTAVDALFRDAGVIRTDTVEELFHVGALLSHQPLPRGRRVAILTNAGGPGILAADACESLGLKLATLSDATTAALAALLPPAASVRNPVDMLATAPADSYLRALPLLLDDPGVDSVLTIFIPPLVTRTDDVAEAIASSARGSSKPVLATFCGAAGIPAALAPVPCYVFPESAIAALARVVEYENWRSQPTGIVPELPDFRAEDVRCRVAKAEINAEGWLDAHSAFDVLEACGLSVAPIRTVVSAEGALAAAAQAGYPVVLKGEGPALLHKTEAGAVYTNLASEEAVTRAFHALDRRPDITRVIVQPQVRDGVEMFAGGMLDSHFGHLVMCGSGGTLLELMRDTAARLVPLTDRSAAEMVNEIRGRRLLRGYRGSAPVDEQAYRIALLRVSALLNQCPEITELDLNPIIVTTEGAFVVDARIRLRTPPQP